MSMAYLAISYTGHLGKNCPELRKDWSYSMANAYAAALIDAGELIYSPITHSHPLSKYMPVHGSDHDFWMDYDERMMALCDRMYIVDSLDWRESQGVIREIFWFKHHKRPIWLINMEDGIIKKRYYHSVGGTVMKVEQLNIFQTPLDK